jgi:hypothetical protein
MLYGYQHKGKCGPSCAEGSNFTYSWQGSTKLPGLRPLSQFNPGRLRGVGDRVFGNETEGLHHDGRRTAGRQGRRPFVGPAGKLLDKCLEEAKVDRRKVYVTNTVKHFKWEPRGKLRIHKKPSMEEILQAVAGSRA